MAKKKVQKHHVQKKSDLEGHAHTHKEPKAWYNNVVIWQIAFLILLIVVIATAFPNITGFSRSTYSGDGTITIVEYADFNCPACLQAQPIVNQLKEIYGDAITWEIRHFAFQGPTSDAAAQAVECARDQGKEVEYKAQLYANFREYSNAQLKQYAVAIGLNAEQFNRCLDSGEKASVVQQHMAEGRALGVAATPTFIVNGERVQGALPLADFRRLIDSHLDSGATTQQPAAPVDDPEVEFIVISDPACTVCGEQEVIDITTQQLFPTAVVRIIEKDSSEAQQLIQQLGLTRVPAYIFGNTVVDTQNYMEVSGALESVGAYHYIVPEALMQSGFAFRLLEEINVEGRPTLGDPSAPVTILEWSDFTCPFCERHHSQTHKQLVSQYVDSGDVKIVRLNLLWGQEPRATQSRNAALANECAFAQDRFWDYHDALYLESNYDRSVLIRIAEGLGLDMAAFTSCFDSQEYLSVINADQDLARQYGISGTPGFLINGISVMGAFPLDHFQEIIDSELSS